MNFNKDLFEKSEAKEFGEFENLELGGHELVIMNAKEYTSDISGNTSLRICVDTTKTDIQPEFFMKQYQTNPNEDKTWPNSAIRYLSLKDEQMPYLKGFITALKNSNKGFKFNTNGEWKQLEGLKIAGQFGWEEFKDNEGKIKTATKLIQFRSLDKLKEITIPKVKLLDGKRVDYDDYMEFYVNKNNEESTSEIEIDNSKLPF